MKSIVACSIAGAGETRQLGQNTVVDLDVLPDAAAAALALPDLRGRSVDASRARRA